MSENSQPMPAEMPPLRTTQSISTSTVRSVNQRIILDRIFEKHITSRTELSNDLLISKPAILII
jgi:hypothetical protein